MPISTKNIGLILALVVTLWLTWQMHESDQQDESGAMTPTSEHARTVRNTTSPSTISADFALSPRVALDHEVTNVFVDPSIKQQASQPKKIVEAPPEAPPLPFELVGIMKESNDNKLIVNHNDEVLVLHDGDLIGHDYQYLGATKVGARTQLSFKYLPMKLTQTMMVENEQ